MSLEGRQRGRYFAAKLRSSSVWTMRSRFSWSGIFFGSRLFGLAPLNLCSIGFQEVFESRQFFYLGILFFSTFY